MEFGGGIDDQSEMWGWQSQEYDLQKDLLAADAADPSSCLWSETSHNAGDAWSMFDEQTPIKHCTDIDFQFCDIGDIVVKDFDEGKETLQAKRRRMLQFCPDNVEMDCAMAADGLSESLQVNLGFSGHQCLLNCDGTEELPEEWLVDCSQQDNESCCPPEEISPAAALEEANLSVHENSSSQEQSNTVQKTTMQSRPTPLKAGKNIIRARKVKTSVVYPFELIKPCGFHGDITLHDINQRIHAPPPYKIKHKVDEEQLSYQTSAISGKPVVHKTRIHTEGGKGSITITRTRG
ncbi:protein XRI1-like isoform X3 [Oryza brachyantha]|uniref:protein XRI1-like isoform X3 n=1 Tax=Oryza brachyantha TaxID=4533 RepID=UPI0007763300|nr:protein XRI1-like isoform X3 [Oryza brachyantha]